MKGTMLSSKRALIYHANSFIQYSHPRPHSSNFNYVACFSSSKGTSEGPEDGYGESRLATESGRNKRVEDEREKMKMKDAPKDTAEIGKAATVEALETGLMFGEMAKNAMDGMWDAAKKTGENIRDSVADDENQPPQTSTDKHVEDLRRKARGYDLKDR